MGTKTNLDLQMKAPPWLW